MGNTLLSVIGPVTSSQPSCPWPSRAASASQIWLVGPVSGFGAVRHLQIEPGDRRGPHGMQREPVVVPGIDQLVGRRGDVGEDPEPGVRVDPFPVPADVRGDVFAAGPERPVTTDDDFRSDHPLASVGVGECH